MRLSPATCPKTLDQWYELCHPEDHFSTSRLEQTIYGTQEVFVSVVRRLYCGDGYYRNFRLDAFIQRGQDGRPVKFMGSETLALGAWLALAEDGERIECEDMDGRVRVLEAVRVAGVMSLRDVDEVEDLRRENMTLRREIQRRIFARGTPFVVPSSEDAGVLLRTTLEENINLALNVLTGSNQLKALRRSVNESALTVGIVGLTGSGKSSFLNALLGERLIPEQSRASTHTIIICREGETRAATVYYQDGRVEEVRDISASYMKSITGTSGVARIEMTIPGAMIPEELCFVDTPGFDVLAGSSGAVLRNILPELDIIIYITPIRSRLKGSDYDYLKAILAMNKRIVFVLSQIDLERNDTEAGRVIHSAESKIKADIEAIRQDMKKFSGLDVDVIPVSAKKAVEKFYDRRHTDWASSNIEGIKKYFERFSHGAFTRAMVCRTERTLTLLDGVIARREVSGSSRWRIGNITDRLKKMLCVRGNLPEVLSGYVFTESVESAGTQGENLLSSLMASMKEREFRGRFFELETLKERHKVVLLGAERYESLKLYSRLAHNLMLETLPEGSVSADEWLCSGYSPPFGCISLPVAAEGYTILIAPSMPANNIDWHKLFAEYVPVVSVDLARVDSGLSDIAHSPYITGLALYKWILSFGNAGLFDTRQIDLVSHVPGRVNEFIEMNGLKSPEWFIYENYKIF